MSEGKPLKKYVLRSLAILLALSGAVIFVLGSHDFVVSSFGLLALLASGQLVRMSRAQNPSFGRLNLTASRGPGRVMWILGGTLLVLAGASFWLMHLDQLHGGQAVWPVYLAFGVVLVGIPVWSYIVWKLTSPGN